MLNEVVLFQNKWFNNFFNDQDGLLNEFTLT